MHLPPQAIQDITRNRDIDPEEIVSLIFERIDVKGEGKAFYALQTAEQSARQPVYLTALPLTPQVKWR